MARPRKPTNVLELSGAFKHDPQRRRGNEPCPTGEIGDPPKSLKRKVLKDIWFEMIAIAPPGVLKNSDRVHLEIICHLLGDLRKSPADFPVTKLTRLEAMIGKLGLNPSDRSKVSGLGKGKPKNPFSNL